MQLLLQDGSLTRINHELAYATTVLAELAGRLEMSKHFKAEANWKTSKTGTGLSKKDLSGLGEPEPSWWRQ